MRDGERGGDTYCVDVRTKTRNLSCHQSMFVEFDVTAALSIYHNQQSHEQQVSE